MRERDVRAHLVVSVEPPAVLARLTIMNEDSKPFAIETYHLCADGKMEKELFEIVDENGEEVSYEGRTIKRAPPRLGDFVHIPPGGQTSSIIRLDQYYNLTNHRSYCARYVAIISSPRGSDLLELESEEVRFYV